MVDPRLPTDTGAMSIRDWPSAERPREKLLAQGAGALSDAELLAIFLGSGLRGRDAVETARDLLQSHGPLRNLLDLPASALAGRSSRLRRGPWDCNRSRAVSTASRPRRPEPRKIASSSASDRAPAPWASSFSRGRSALGQSLIDMAPVSVGSRGSTIGEPGANVSVNAGQRATSGDSL